MGMGFNLRMFLILLIFLCSGVLFIHIGFEYVLENKIRLTQPLA